MEITIEGIAATIGVVVTLSVFIVQMRQANGLRRQENYLQLELASNEVFRFEAANGAVIERARASGPQTADFDTADSAVIENYILQCLNLFEIAIRYREEKMFDRAIFGSWVAWFHELHTYRYFREIWPDMRMHYTPDLRKVMDVPVASWGDEMDEDARLAAFFGHVAKVLKCRIVRDWIGEAGPKAGVGRA